MTAYDTNNIFAKILRDEAPCVKIFENDDVLAFMDIFPQSQGHCLVIPKNTTARNLLEFAAEAKGTFALAEGTPQFDPDGQDAAPLWLSLKRDQAYELAGSIEGSELLIADCDQPDVLRRRAAIFR